MWLSEVMLQQTTTAHAAPYFRRFTELWPSVEALAAAPREDVLREWAGLGYYARARNLHACARAVAARGGFPRDEAALRALPGIGRYTAAAVAAIAFDAPAVPVDGNVERVTARLFAVETPLPDAKPQLARRAAALAPPARHGDFAQALMDLGATICVPRRPLCGRCPWSEACRARALGLAAELPRKAPKAAKPVRFGTAWVALRGGEALVETRAETGLLGGMTGPPCSPFAPEPPETAAPLAAEWREAGEARHVFTHFQLRLRVLAARIEAPPPSGLRYAPFAEARRAAPTALRKALDLGHAALEPEAGAP